MRASETTVIAIASMLALPWHNKRFASLARSAAIQSPVSVPVDSETRRRNVRVLTHWVNPRRSAFYQEMLDRLPFYELGLDVLQNMALACKWHHSQRGLE